jgi:RNA polymerase nonessential primary-like sigma factor
MEWDEQVARFKILEEGRALVESGDFRQYNAVYNSIMRAREELILAVRYLVLMIVDKYSKRPNRRDEYISEGYHAIIDGVDLFRLEKGIRWTTYASSCIRYRMYKVDKSSSLIHIPFYVYDGTAKRPEDIADVPLEEIKKLCNPSRLKTTSKNESWDRERETPIVYNEDINQFERTDNSQVVHRALAMLNERLRFVATKRMNGLTLKEIGDEMGVTKERVRQIETEAFDKLKQYLLKLGYVHG